MIKASRMYKAGSPEVLARNDGKLDGPGRGEALIRQTYPLHDAGWAHPDVEDGITAGQTVLIG